MSFWSVDGLSGVVKYPKWMLKPYVEYPLIMSMWPNNNYDKIRLEYLILR